jgi:hypothetical protein
MNSATQDKTFADNNHAKPLSLSTINHTRGARSKNHQLRIDSMTGVYPKHTHGLGVWGNPRVVFSVRVDKGLKKRFTDVSRRVFGSTCNPIESFMATVVGSASDDLRSGVYPSITIGEIKIERNLRERRKLDVEPEESVEPEVLAVAETQYCALNDGSYRFEQLPCLWHNIRECPNGSCLQRVLKLSEEKAGRVKVKVS